MSTLEQKRSFKDLTDREVEVLFWIVYGLEEKIIAEKLHIKEVTVSNHLNAIYGKFNLLGGKGKLPVLISEADDVLHEYVKTPNHIKIMKQVRAQILKDIKIEEEHIEQTEQEAGQQAQEPEKKYLVDEPEPEGLWRTPLQKAEDKQRRLEIREIYLDGKRLLEEREDEIEDLKRQLGNLKTKQEESDSSKQVIKKLEERIKSLEAELLENKTKIAEIEAASEEIEPLIPPPKPHIEPDNIYFLVPEDRVKLFAQRTLKYYEYVSYQKELGKLPRTFDKWLDSVRKVPLEEYIKLQQGNIEIPDIDPNEKPPELTDSEFDELEEYKKGIQKWYEDELKARLDPVDEPQDGKIDEPESPSEDSPEKPTDETLYEPPDEHPIIIPEAPAKVEEVIDDSQEEESDDEDSDDSFVYIPPDPDPIIIEPAGLDPKPEIEDKTPPPPTPPPGENNCLPLLILPFWLIWRGIQFLFQHPTVLLGFIVIGTCCYVSNITGLLSSFPTDTIRSALLAPFSSSSSEVVVPTPTASSPVKIARRVTASEYIAENRLKATVSESMTYLDNHFQFYFQVSNIGDDDLILSLQPKQFLLYDNMGNNYYAFPDNTVEERDIFTLKPKEFKMYVFKEDRAIRFFGPRDPEATKYFFKVESFYTLPDVIWTYYVE